MRALLAVALMVGMVVAAVPASPTTAQSPADTAQLEDPDQDVIGWEDGYWHNESIDVDQSDGLNSSEMDAYIARGMARVEYIRDREFQQSVPVEVMTREEYQNQTGGGDGDGGLSAFAQWNNQVWEGLFIVGEDTNAQNALSSTSGSTVAGFYSPTDDQITIITPNTSSPTISNATLLHELTHALQDQYIDLTDTKYFQGVDGTQDASLAVEGLIEGEANYVEAIYTDRCGGEWACVETPAQNGGGAPPDLNFGIYLTIFQPYSDGPAWVHDIVESEGWAGLEARYDDIPASSEQIIHHTEEAPEQLSFQDNGEDGWRSWPSLGVNGADTVGEASIFSMFWYQSRNYQAGIVDVQSILNTQGEYDIYDYSAPPSSGWANDLLVPYHRGSGADVEYGYVWKTEWDTSEDASEFASAYQQILAAHGAAQPGENTWVIEDGSFADAFHIVQDGTSVTIINGPTVEDLTAIRPSITVDAETTTTTTTTTTTEEPTTTSTSTTTQSTTTTTTSGDDGPGFTVGLTVVAVVIGLVLLGRRQ